MFSKRITYIRIPYIKIAGWLLIALDLGQDGKKVKKFPTKVNKTIILNFPPTVSEYQFSVSICKVLSTKMAFQL